MAYDVGGAYATFNLKIDSFEANYARVDHLLGQLEQRIARPFTARVGLQGAGSLARAANGSASVGVSNNTNGGVQSGGSAGAGISQNTQLLNALAGATNNVIVAEEKRLRVTAQLQRNMREYAAAIQSLALIQVNYTEQSTEYIQVEAQKRAIMNQALGVYNQLEDALITEAKLANDATLAQERYNKAIALAQANHDPVRATRLSNDQDKYGTQQAGSLVKDANAQAKANADLYEQESRRLKSLSDLQRQQKDYGAAMQTLTQLEARFAQGSAAANRVSTMRASLQKQMTREAQLTADADIRAARSARDYAGAIALLNREIAAANAAGNQTRAGNLQAQLSQVQRGQSQASFFTSVANGAKQIVAPLGAAVIALTAFNAVKDELTSSLEISRNMAAAQRSVEAFFQNVNRGTNVMREAIAFGDRYKLSYREIADAVEDAQIILRTSNSTTEQTLSVIARLQARQPSKTFQDAVRSVAELQAGQLQSIQRVFNIPAKYAQEAQKAIESGIDPIEAVDKILNKLGNTDATLAVRTQGLAGAQRNWTNAVEGTEKALGDLLSGPASDFLNWGADAIRTTGDIIEGFQGLSNLKSPGDIFKNFNKNNQASFSGGFDPRQFVANISNPGLTAFKALSTVGTNAYKAIGQAGSDAAATQTEANAKVVQSIDDIIRKAVEAQPVLTEYLPNGGKKYLEPKTSGGSGFGDNAVSSLDAQIAKLNVLNSQYDAGMLKADEYAKRVKELLTPEQSGQQGTLRFVEMIVAQVGTAQDKLTQLNQLRQIMQQQMGAAQTIQEKVLFTAEYSQVVQAIAMIEAQSPIQMSVEMQIGYMSETTRITQELTNAAQQYADGLTGIQQAHSDTLVGLGQRTIDLNRNFAEQEKRATRDFGQQQLMQQRDFDQSMQRADEDFYRARARTIRDFDQQQAKAQRDFQLGQARQARDYAISEGRWNEDAARQLRRQARDRQLEDERSYAGHLLSMQNIRRSYDVSAKRSEEDYERQRRRLLAEGKIYEARLLKEEYDVDRTRAGEDYGRSRSDESDSYSEDVARRNADRRRQDADAAEDAAVARARRQEDYARSRADAQEDYARSRADAAAAFAQQLADSAADYARQRAQKQADYAQQQADQAAAFAQQRADAEAARTAEQNAIDDAIRIENEKYASQQTTLENKYNEHLGKLKTQLEDYKTEQDRIQELISQKVGEEQAKAIAAMERASKELRRIGLEQTAVNGLIGYRVGLEWVKGIGKAFTDYASNPADIDKALDEVNKRLAGDSPPPKGPLRNIDKGAANVAEAWNRAFTETLGKGLDRKLQQYTSVLIEGAKRNNVLATGFRIETQLDAEAHQKRLGYIEREAQKRRDLGQESGRDYTHGSQLGETYNDPIYRVNPRDITPWESERPRYNTPESRNAGPAPIIQVVVPVGMTLDGAKIGEVIAPHIAEQFMGAASISVEVVEASQTIALQQPTFRSKLSG